MRRLLLAVLVVATVSGCDDKADFGVMGSVRSASGSALENCVLEIVADGPLPKKYYTKPFNAPGFVDAVIVPPHRAEYPLIITCSGHRPYRTTIRFGTEILAGQEANLGEITLLPAPENGV